MTAQTHPVIFTGFLQTSLHVVCQAPLSMEFFRQEYWSGLPFPSPGNLPDPEIEPGSPALQAGSLRSEPPGKPEKTIVGYRDRMSRRGVNS